MYIYIYIHIIYIVIHYIIIYMYMLPQFHCWVDLSQGFPPDQARAQKDGYAISVTPLTRSPHGDEVPMPVMGGCRVNSG